MPPPLPMHLPFAAWLPLQLPLGLKLGVLDWFIEMKCPFVPVLSMTEKILGVVDVELTEAI